MGKKDITSKLLTNDNDVFAEIFNKFLFKENVIDPEKLKEKDTTEIVAIAEKVIAEQKYRDILKTAEVKVDDKFAYLLLGIENQSEIHYAMVIRTMLYDALNYSAQMMEIGKTVRKGSRSKYSEAEWLSGFPKGKKIIPVITLILCWKPEKWDAPKSLYEMMDKSIVDRYKKWIDNYTLNLVSVHDLPDKVLASTKTDIGLALEFSKYSNDVKKLKNYQNDSRFENRSNEFVATINEMAGTKFKINPKGGTNMCEGIRQLQEEAAVKAETAKENEDIKNSYELMQEVAPDLDKKTKVKLIAKKFKKTIKYVNSILA